MGPSKSNSTRRASPNVAYTTGALVVGALVGATVVGLSTPMGQPDRAGSARDGAAARQVASGPVDPTGFGVVGESFFAVRVRDARAAAEWYATRLDLNPANLIDDPNGRFAIRILTRPGLTVELIEQAGTPAPPERAPTGHFKAGFFVTDIDAAFAALRNRGVDTDEGVATDEALGVRMFVFRDLEGNRLQIFER